MSHHPYDSSRTCQPRNQEYFRRKRRGARFSAGGGEALPVNPTHNPAQYQVGGIRPRPTIAATSQRLSTTLTGTCFPASGWATTTAIARRESASAVKRECRGSRELDRRYLKVAGEMPVFLRRLRVRVDEEPPLRRLQKFHGSSRTRVWSFEGVGGRIGVEVSRRMEVLHAHHPERPRRAPPYFRDS